MTDVLNNYIDDLSEDVQIEAWENVKATDEYWNLVEEEVDEYLKSEFDMNCDWSFDGIDIYIPNKIYDCFDDNFIMDVKYNALEILDGNNSAMDRAKFDVDGRFVGFI